MLAISPLTSFHKICEDRPLGRLVLMKLFKLTFALFADEADYFICPSRSNEVGADPFYLKPYSVFFCVEFSISLPHYTVELN